jgi:acid phosphatase family membrane protein YuiD
MTDPHEIRMQAGAQAIANLDALDDQTVELMTTAAHALADLTDHLKGHGVDRLGIIGTVVGMIVAAAMRED